MYKEVVANLAAYSHNLDHGILEKDIIEDTEAIDSKLPFGELVRAEAFSFSRFARRFIFQLNLDLVDDASQIEISQSSQRSSRASGVNSMRYMLLPGRLTRQEKGSFQSTPSPSAILLDTWPITRGLRQRKAPSTQGSPRDDAKRSPAAALRSSRRISRRRVGSGGGVFVFSFRASVHLSVEPRFRRRRVSNRNFAEQPGPPELPA